METDKVQAVNPKMLKLVRDRTGMSQLELAERLGCKQPDISKIERGLEVPDWLIRFAKLAAVLDQAKMSWEDVIMEFPEQPLRTAEKGGDYNV
jgi:transcriptional regulator with XRE-family HTH domain